VLLSITAFLHVSAAMEAIRKQKVSDPARFHLHSLTLQLLKLTSAFSRRKALGCTVGSLV